MDPEFVTRYLPEQRADREGAREDGDPVDEPDVGQGPTLAEPGGDLDRALREDLTTVLPRVNRPVAAGEPPRAGPPPEPPPAPPLAGPRTTTPASALTAARESQSEGDAGEGVADSAECTAPVEQTARLAPEPRTGEIESTERDTPPVDQAPQADQQLSRAQPGGAGEDPRFASTPPLRESSGYRIAAPAGASARNAAPPSGVSTGLHRIAPDSTPPRRSGQSGQSSGIAASGAWTGAAAGTHLRPEELVKRRTLPPEMGWRKAVYVGTGHLVNLGAGPFERTLRDQIALIGSNIPRNYQIAVISIKGGVGKTRTVAGIGTVYGMYRTEPVIAIDANPTYGSLGRIIDPSATSSIREFMADDQVNSYPQARSYTGKNRQGLEVLAGNQNVANPLVLSDDLFNHTISRTRRYYQLSLIDCGNHIEHRVMKGVFGVVDALVIVGTTNYDGADAAERTIDWLTVRNMHDLLRRSVLVLNDVNGCYDKDFVTKVCEHLEPRVGAVKTIPWDKHLRDGAELDFEALRRRTQLAYIELAAWLAEGFATARTGAR